MIKTRLAEFGFFRTPLAVSLALVLATSAFAQETTPATTQPTISSFNANGTQEASTERIVVTGSYIPTAGEVGPNPVSNYSREAITKSGERNIEQFLRNLPAANEIGRASCRERV